MHSSSSGCKLSISSTAANTSESQVSRVPSAGASEDDSSVVVQYDCCAAFSDLSRCRECQADNRSVCRFHAFRRSVISLVLWLLDTTFICQFYTVYVLACSWCLIFSSGGMVAMSVDFQTCDWEISVWFYSIPWQVCLSCTSLVG